MWIDDLDLPRLGSGTAEVLFHAGCRFSFDQQLQQSARVAVGLLKKGGLNIGILGKHEMCCGGRIYSMGYRDEFTRLARANMAAWAKAGVKEVVTSCSDCYHAFKRLYGRLGSQVKVFHTLEYLDLLIQQGKLRFQREVPLRVTYHDPCHLGRQGEAYIPWEGVEKKIKGQIVVYEPKKPRYNGAWGIYDPPRNVLKHIPGLELVEMERIREYSWCCGAGGGVREAYPEFSQWTAGERIAEAKATGAEALATACPWCERNFMDAINAHGDSMRVYDVVDLVQEAI
jgi:Fe-S oxidoreductase